MRRSAALLLALGTTLGVGATAVAQGGGNRLSIDMQDGCLNHPRVSFTIEAPSGEAIRALTVYANGRQVLDLTDLSGDARMTVRLTSPRGRVSIQGDLAGGESFQRSRDYRPCAPRPARPAPHRPEPMLTGGGEG